VPCEERNEKPVYCPACERRYPQSLLKSLHDPFHYSLQLRGGEIIRFTAARIKGEFAHLMFDDLYPANRPFPFERGVDVRIADIVWSADGKH
jgi:hypothetical protein